MEYDTGLKGPTENTKDEWDIEYKTLKQQLKMKKVIVEDIIQERINPLVPLDGVVEEDIEILQYLGEQKQNEESSFKKDLREEDKKLFIKARNEMVGKEAEAGSIRLIPKKRTCSSSLVKLKKSLKIKKILE